MSGLVTGSDILSALKSDRLTGARLLIPSCMLRHEQDRFLDDMTVDELSSALKMPVEVIENGAALARALMRGEEKPNGKTCCSGCRPAQCRQVNAV